MLSSNLARLCNPLQSRSFFLFGARGTGKSTLINTLIPEQKRFSVNLLLPADYEELSLDPSLLIAKTSALPASIEWIVIDEVQKLPVLLDIVHHLIEEKRFKFALTGSSARKLKRQGANLLAGRASVYHLFPFTATELGPNFSLTAALEWGTLPEVIKLGLPSPTADEARTEFLKAYTHTYLKEEVAAEQILRKLEPFRRFLNIAAQSNSKIINYKKIADDVGVAPATVKTYFEILAETLVGFFLDSFHQSVRKSQRQSPKFYLFDSGIERVLARTLDVKLRDQTYAYGEAFEGFFINEVNRLNHYYRKDYQLSYLRTGDDAEIDLIVEGHGNNRILIEIKSTALVRESDTSALARLAKDIKHSAAIIVSRDPSPKRFGTVEALPWSVALERIFA